MNIRSIYLKAATVSGLAIALGATAPAFAQSANDRMVECQQLYDTWSKYNGSSKYGNPGAPDVALQDCRKGNYAAGIAYLKDALHRNAIPDPTSETARAGNK
ncbi:MAG: hypothetical protein JSR90_16140 [Proteobacteria bacterium]|nr:hypothetical protein [Pseudomonadota bacterium]